LPGGELWGVMEDAMPRFTYQILLPFLLILILTTWRNQPQRWPWLMVMAGLLAFVHPVSTPTWAFALWLGFWAIFPDGWNTYRKLLELAKLGLVLALALLPYVLIYFHYHQSGSNSNYDLVYYVISEYFPTNILNMRGALIQLYAAVAQNGLLWVGLFGMLVTFFIFHTVWPYIRQMLYWVAGIIIITILVPWGEQVIEHSLRMVPLQTEIMRGMRYLVLFVFIFAFLPFAELTRRLHSRVIKYMVLLIGSAATIGWLLVNPPYPLSALPVTIQCFAKEKIICPYDLEYADVLKQIQVQTPLRSKFVVFLQNRWSGIEVRYLSLRPMAYAYKDKGQLAFTNIPALEQWLEFQKKEDMIFKDRFSPTLEQKFERIDRFARNAGADYVLTNFPFTSEDQNRVGLRIIYQNQEYSILKIIR
jgi:hypothetical protein